MACDLPGALTTLPPLLVLPASTVTISPRGLLCVSSACCVPGPPEKGGVGEKRGA